MSRDDDEQAITEDLLAHFHSPSPQQREVALRFFTEVSRAGLLRAFRDRLYRDYQSFVDDTRAEIREVIARETFRMAFEALQAALRKGGLE